MKTYRKYTLTAGAVIIIGVVAFMMRGSIVAHAAGNPFSNFWNDLTTPLTSQTANQSSTIANATTTYYTPKDQYESDVMAAVKKVDPAVVSITVSENVPIIENCPNSLYYNIPQNFRQFFGTVPTSTPCKTGKTKLEQVAGGSGFIISSNGLILTNKHVVANKNASYSVLMNNGKTYTAKVLARDPNQDLAVVKINATGLPTVTLGDSNGLQLGQTAIAIGNALGEYSNTVSAGVVSGLERTVTASSPDTGAVETIQGVIQTDAAINPGNSGGPLVDLRGDVIGIDTAVASNAQNIGFAIPINQAKSIINSIESTGKIQAPFLGVRYEMVTSQLATQKKLPIAYGALITGDAKNPAVVSGSPAAKAGIKAGDIIVSVNGVKLNNGNSLGNLIDQHSAGDKVTLVINRGGKQLTMQVTLGTWPSSTATSTATSGK